MLSVTDGILLDDLSLMMAFELLIVIALIILFIVSLCSLLQKIRRAYDQDGGDRRCTDRRLTQIYVHEGPPNYGESQGEMSHGVYPGGISPPSYTEYYDPPPKYDDIIKSDPPAAPAPALVHQNPSQSQPISVVSQ